MWNVAKDCFLATHSTPPYRGVEMWQQDESKKGMEISDRRFLVSSSGEYRQRLNRSVS